MLARSLLIYHTADKGYEYIITGFKNSTVNITIPYKGDKPHTHYKIVTNTTHDFPQIHQFDCACLFASVLLTVSDEQNVDEYKKLKTLMEESLTFKEYKKFSI